MMAIFSKLFGGGAAAASADVIGFDDLCKALETGSVALIDVREPGEFAGGHAAGAVNLPLSRFDVARAPRDRKVVLICQSGGRSGRALHQLRTAGFDNAVHFAGGTSLWRSLGGPIES